LQNLHFGVEAFSDSVVAREAPHGDDLLRPRRQSLAESHWFAEDGEQRYQIIGLADGGVLLTVVFVFRSDEGDEIIRTISARKATTYETKLYSAQD
jgi:uncharacterized DUF497 family protein